MAQVKKSMISLLMQIILDYNVSYVERWAIKNSLCAWYSFRFLNTWIMWYFGAIDNHQCSQYLVSWGWAAAEGDSEYLNLGGNMELCDRVYRD